LKPQVRVWDVASGRLLRKLVGCDFALVEGPSGQHTRDLHVLMVGDSNETLLIYAVAREQQLAEDGRAATPVACFKAPARITSVRCHGAAICVSCCYGEVCLLSAPFLTA